MYRMSRADKIEQLASKIARMRRYGHEADHNGDDAEAVLNHLILEARELTGETGLTEDDEMCPDCGAVEGFPEWGTVGDGFDGYCPSCADKREEQGVYE